ncbi:unnamed protein product, partial [Mesorhabditis belari]|uniref:Uncharacterized protein n=1 Tax=Mesorhabditis belari TaxID=2138241 RepID=A0AAF3FKU4_9BILA
MASNKRKKKDNSDEESDEVDWEMECRKKVRQLEEAYDERLVMASKTGRLEWELKRANDQLLGSKSMLSARGVIEWLEERHDREMPDSVRRDVRHDRWKWIFDNDPTFRNEG